jgi:hypothetical protein
VEHSSIVQELHPEELALAAKISNLQVRMAFLGGRVALRRALAANDIPIGYAFSRLWASRWAIVSYY